MPLSSKKGLKHVHRHYTIAPASLPCTEACMMYCIILCTPTSYPPCLQIYAHSKHAKYVNSATTQMHTPHVSMDGSTLHTHTHSLHAPWVSNKGMRRHCTPQHLSVFFLITIPVPFACRSSHVLGASIPVQQELVQAVIMNMQPEGIPGLLGFCCIEDVIILMCCLVLMLHCYVSSALIPILVSENSRCHPSTVTAAKKCDRFNP